MVTEFDIKADVLVSLALIASIIIGEYFAAGEVAVIMQLGALLENVTVAKACAGIERLVNLTPQTAHVVSGEEERTSVAGIKKLGIIPVLLTGDHSAAANHIASQVGVAEVQADCLPEDKLTAITAFEENQEKVCMVGDGINDAPALKRAYVGVAMGGVGSDIAVDAADIVLVRDNIDTLPHMLALSRRMMTTIKLNMTFSMTLNFVAIILAMAGILNPVVGALVHNAGSVLVIANSALLLRWKMKGSVEFR